MLSPLNKSSDFDVVFDGVNFVTALLAYSSVKSGCKVAIKNIENSSNLFQPEISNFYPQSLVGFPTAKKKYTFFENCYTLFPYYLVPQRLLRVNTNKEFNKKLHLQADIFLQFDREFASLPVTLAKYPAFAALSTHFSEGLLHFELRFDRQRAMVDLLKKCKAEGAVLLTNDEPIVANYSVKSSSTISGVYCCTIPDFKLISGNNVRIGTDYFTLDIQSVLTESQITVHFHKNLISFQQVEKEFESIVYRLNLPYTHTLIHWFQKSYNDFELPNDEELISDYDLANLQKVYLRLEKMLSKHLGKKLSLSSVVKILPQRKMSFLNFQQIQRECDEKFDEAKQTGVSYALFTQLFYRYSASIDQMIELAYEKTGSQLSPETVWKMVELQLVEEERKLLFE